MCRTSTYARSYLVRSKRVWNVLPKEIRRNTTSLSSYKDLLKEYYPSALKSTYDSEDARTCMEVSLCYAPVNVNPPSRGGGGGDLAWKVVSYDCKYVPDDGGLGRHFLMNLIFYCWSMKYTKLFSRGWETCRDIDYLPFPRGRGQFRSFTTPHKCC
jgi:hypothetical protein